MSWLRLSVIGSLQYELNVAEIAAQSVGLTGLRLEEMSINSFITIALVMTVGILGGLFYTLFFLKKYLDHTPVVSNLYLILVVMLWVKPSGLFGKKGG